jgi:tetratricopeptide (TPR) repeat protein
MVYLPAVLLAPIPPPQTAYSPRGDLDAGRYLKALADAEGELRRNPGSALAWAAKSQALSALLRFGEADEAAEKALALNANLADAHLARGICKAGQAVQQRNLGSVRKASSALQDFRRAAELDPSLTAAWNSLGLAYQQMPGLMGGSTREALRCADRLTQASPARGALLRGMVLALDDRWREAEPFLRKAVDLAPQDPQVVYGYLDALGLRATREAMGREAWKSKLAQEARRLWPGVRGSGRALQAVTDALLDADQGEEAWTLAQQARQSVDAPSLAKLQLGKISARAGIHREEGLAILDALLSEPLEGGTGGYAALHWRRGQILKELGRPEAARAAAREALRMDPKHPGAVRLLKDLDRR